MHRSPTPVLSTSSAVAFTPTLENSGGNSGNTASNLNSRVVSDADGVAYGIAVCEINTEDGFWEYWRSNGHGGWATLPEPSASLTNWGALVPEPRDGGVLELRCQGEPWGDVVGGDINNSDIAGRHAVELRRPKTIPLKKPRLNMASAFIF